MSLVYKRSNGPNTYRCGTPNVMFDRRTAVFDWDVLLLLLVVKQVGSARLRESGIHPISPKTPAPQYLPIYRKKRKGKRVEDYSRDRAT